LDLVHLINAKDATARALPRGRNGLRYLVLCPTDRVMHNIVHAQIRHTLHKRGLVDLRQMIDLALLIDECGGAIDWQEIEGRFASAGAVAVLHDQAAVLREMFGHDVPVTVADAAATATRLRHAIAKSRTGFKISGAEFTSLREIAAEYWAEFRGQPRLAINLLNPMWWPQRIRGLRARYKR
ncbi:MAG: nucleotidyltransferase family protein, partial [Pseudomonadota bacterium]